MRIFWKNTDVEKPRENLFKFHKNISGFYYKKKLLSTGYGKNKLPAHFDVCDQRQKRSIEL